MLSFTVYVNITVRKVEFCGVFFGNMKKASSILNSLLFLIFVVERKNERTVLEYPFFRTRSWCQYVSNKEDSRFSCKRDPRSLKRRALATLLRYCTASIMDSFCGLYCMEVLVTG